MKFTPGPYRPYCHHAGFTVIELMTAVAILGILAALAAPSFTVMIERWRVREAAESLQATLGYARSEAIRRGGDVKITQHTRCASGQWECGWAVTGKKPDGTWESLRTVQLGGGLNIAASAGDVLDINRWGLPTSNAEWRLLPPSGNLAASSRVCLGMGGLIQRRAYDSASASIPNC